jgi:hypothetical protein
MRRSESSAARESVGFSASRRVWIVGSSPSSGSRVSSTQVPSARRHATSAVAMVACPPSPISVKLVASTPTPTARVPRPRRPTMLAVTVPARSPNAVTDSIGPSSSHAQALREVELVRDGDRRLHDVDASERLVDPDERPPCLHAAEARRRLALRERKQERQRARSCDQRDVLVHERLALRFTKRLGLVDPERGRRHHRELPQIVEWLGAECFGEMPANARIAASDPSHREPRIAKDPLGALDARGLDPRGDLPGLKRMRHSASRLRRIRRVRIGCGSWRGARARRRWWSPSCRRRSGRACAPCAC